jgi:hypothetical protein
VGTVKYTPAAVEKTYTVYVCASVPGGLGWSAQLTGCVGTFRTISRAGERMQADFTLSGALEDEADITYVSGVMALTPPFPTHLSSDVTFGPLAYKPCVETINFDIGNTLALVPCMNAVAGIEGYYVSSRVPTFRADPQLDRETASQWFKKIKDGDLITTSWQCGTTANNRVKFNFNAAGAANVQVITHTQSARGGILSLETEFLATVNAGNDEFAIIFD